MSARGARPNSGNATTTTASAGGNLMVHNAELFVDFVESLPPHPYESAQQYSDEYGREEEPMYGTDELEEHEVVLRKRHRQEREQYLQKINVVSQKRRLQVQQKKDEEFVNLYNSLIEDRTYVINNLSHMLNLEMENDERKRAEVYEKWIETVFNPIQEQIDQKLQSTPTEVIERRRRKMFEQFLQMSNKKPLFRDIILPQDAYDPVEHVQKHSIKYTKNEKQKRGKQRDTLAPVMWDKMDATPYGHYEKDHKPTMRAKEKVQSNVNFDHYDKSRYSDFSKFGKRISIDSNARGNGKRSLGELTGHGE